MNHRREQVLKIDTFGQAVRGNQNARFAFFHGVNALTPLFRCVFTGDGLDRGLGKGFAQVFRYVVGRGYITAEHHGVVAVFHQFLDMPDKCGQLRVTCLPGETFGLLDQALQAACLFQLRGRFQVAAVEVIGLSIMQAFVG
ncbi:hypothetical protein D3C77_477680 [compost metagenome]